jgi:cytochrome c oxidase subunit 2
MMLQTRRTLLKSVLGTVGAGSLVALTGWRTAHAMDAPRIIEVTARRFSFAPNEITAKAGERVVLEVKSVDFPHGMNFPDFKIRADLVPGRITRIELPVQRAGIYEFVCDNFCGDGHEEMHGKLVVTG